jgi:molybdate transport system regulatory protein
MRTGTTVELTLRLRCGSEIAMGPGKADLLEAIRAQGSISAAARTMEMSYRRAWLLVDAMNRCWKEPLVATLPGRAHGGSARLTAQGEAVLMHYRTLQASLGVAVDGTDRAALIEALLPEPRSSQRH